MDIETVLGRGVSDVLPSREALAKLMEERPITLYQGFDPTAPSLHIGHFIGIRKLAQFQKLGHKVIFLIGDGTGQAGDPSGKTKAREKFFTNAELRKNAQGYKDQVAHMVEFSGKDKAELKYNSEWLNELGLVSLLDIAGHFTVQQLIERDLFQKRIASNEPINLREFLYPLLQGYDSVAMDVDLEIGGTDQLFNMMSGRTLMKSMLNKNKFILTTKLLTDAEGKKMGKSEGNAMNLSDPAEQIYGSMMALPDEIIDSMVELLTDFPLDFRQNKDPMSAKKEIAFNVTKQIKGSAEAKKAQAHFEKTFQKKAPEYKEKIENKGRLVDTLLEITGSKSEVKRLLKHGAISVNGRLANNPTASVRSGDRIKVGVKKFVIVK